MSLSTVTIAGRKIGPDAPPYIIAEMSANHGGDLQRALKIIDLAAEAGADCIKFQAYQAHTMTLDSDAEGFVIRGDNPWLGEKLYDLYKRAATPYDWFPQLFEHARRRGITPFCSPFDYEAIDMLEALEAPAYKIASFELVDLELIERCARTGKPLIISSGMASAEDIADGVAAARRGGATEIIVLKCTSDYPSDPAEANLATMVDMGERFQVPVGLSDHTLGSAVAIAAVASGACVIEKHFIDAREPVTADSTFSALPNDLRALVDGCRAAYLSRGKIHYGPADHERQSLAFRRSLYVVADVGEGEILTRENVRCIRPGFGLKPKHLPDVLGRPARRTLRRGHPLSLDDIG